VNFAAPFSLISTLVLFAQVVPDGTWLKSFLELTTLGAVLWYLDRWARAWQKHDSKQAKKFTDSTRDMNIACAQMTLMTGRLGSALDRSKGISPSESVIQQEKETKALLERLREEQAASLEEDSEDSSDKS
jgi:hypothetical protein